MVAMLYNNRAAAYMTLNEYQEAMQDCRKALALEPRNAKVDLACILLSFFCCAPIDSCIMTMFISIIL